MRVFISHKQEDGSIARSVLSTLKSHKVDAYLDLLDGQRGLTGKALTDHIKGRLNECTDLLVVMSEKTRLSWWVPFEIGMAAQRDFPVVNYLRSGIELPEYLDYWPRLKNETDLANYVMIAKSARTRALLERAQGLKGAESSTARFYRELKAAL